MYGLVKNKHHNWRFSHSFRIPNRRVDAFECRQCKCQKNNFFDALTHRHIKTEYMLGREITTKAPECFARANLLPFEQF